MDPPPGYPCPAEEIAGARRRPARPRPTLELPQQPLGLASLASLKKVDFRDLVEALADASSESQQIFLLRSRRPAPARTAPIANGPGERLVIRVPRAAELLDQYSVGAAFEKLRLANVGLSASGNRLRGDPSKVFEALVAARQDVYGVLQRHGAGARETPSNLCPQVQRLGWKLVDQRIPREGHSMAYITCQKSISIAGITGSRCGRRLMRKGSDLRFRISPPGVTCERSIR